MSDSATLIDLVRHGTVATPGLFCAHPEEPLSEAGWQQLTRTTQATQVDQVITSPSVRCHTFASQFAAARQLPLQTLNGLQEMQFGEWVGLSALEVWQRDAELLQTLWQSPLSFIAPQGEALTEFAERVEHSWHQLVAEHSSKRVLIITHGGVIRVLLAFALGIPYKNTLGFELGYGSAVRMRAYNDGVVSVYGLGVRDLSA